MGEIKITQNQYDTLVTSYKLGKLLTAELADNSVYKTILAEEDGTITVYKNNQLIGAMKPSSNREEYLFMVDIADPTETDLTIYSVLHAIIIKEFSNEQQPSPDSV